MKVDACVADCLCRSLVYRIFVSVSHGLWRLSARKFVGIPTILLSDLFSNVISPRGRRYRLIDSDADSLTFVVDTFALHLNAPMPRSAVRLFEMSLENALNEFLGKSKLFF